MIGFSAIVLGGAPVSASVRPKLVRAHVPREGCYMFSEGRLFKKPKRTPSGYYHPPEINGSRAPTVAPPPSQAGPFFHP
eukprot:scaffold70565_cov42-Phaeocystis_antarctica.AAC.1